MLVGGASSAIFPVSATSDSDLEPDTSVQITAEKDSDGDISLDGNLDGWDIQMGNPSKPSGNKSGDDISISGPDDGVTVKNNTESDTESDKDDVKLEDAGNSNSNDSKSDVSGKTDGAAKPADDADADAEDIVVTDLSDLLSASVTRTDKNGDLDVDDAAALHVKAANKSENPAVFKMYFSDVREIKKGADLSTYFNKPALSCKVQGLGKGCTLDVDVAGPDNKKAKSAVEFLKEVEKNGDKDKESGSEKVVSRYAKLVIPAGSSVDFTFDITSSKECAVTVIPVMVQETAVYGDVQSAEWEEKVTFFDHIVNFFTGKQPEKESEDDGDIQISDVQGISADVPEGLNKDDFASKRLMVLADDPSVFVGKNNVIGQYGNLYLMQFDTVEAAMQAYGYYKDIVTAVEPDVPVEVASGVDAGDTENDVTLSDEQGSDTENDADVNDVSADGTEDANPEDNPINALNAVDTDIRERGVIALIDTGVGEHANVIERISVIDDNAPGNGGSHGDAMVSAIVSQDPEAKILSIKAMDDNGYGTVSSLVAAMEYAIEQKVSVINLSLYARTTLSTSVLKSEIEKAVDAGIIVVGAAGNDGADVKDYVPGSVECAYIIGAAGKDGYRHVLSNYGETVDYNVVAGSTSEASALFAGFVSANGIDAVKGVLNQGLIYETGYGDGKDVVIKPSNPSGEDFSKYDVDEDISVVTRYTFADASKLEDGDTLDTIYHEKEYWDILYGTYLAYPEVYAVGDGTYKIRLDAPIINGYVDEDYWDVVFTRGNDGGNVVTDGVSFDKHTGIATVTDEAFEGVSEDDYADLQVQVLASVNGIPERVMQDVTVVDHDGSQYTITVPVGGLDVESIPLAVEGIEGELTADDFELYLNGERTPYENTYWDADEHTLYANKSCAALVESVKVVLKKDTDSVFRTAYPASAIPGTNAYHGIGTMFWLDDGVEIADGATCDAISRLGADGWDYGLPNGSIIGTASFVTHAGLDLQPDNDSPGMVGIPMNLFGVDFTMRDGAGNPLGDWNSGDGLCQDPAGHGAVSYNRPIAGFCHHTSDHWAGTAMQNDKHKLFHYKILEKWKEGKITYYTMVFFMDEGLSESGIPSTPTQTLGGVVKFGSENDGDEKTINLKVQKKWDDEGDEEKRPSSVTIKLQSAKKVGNGDYSNWKTEDTITLPKADGSWSHTWTDKLRTRKEDSTSPLEVWKYQVVESSVANYKPVYKQFSFKGLSQGSTTVATVTNKIDQKEIDLVAKKVWKDESNALKARPSSVKLMLQKKTRTKKSDGTWGDWSANWTDVSEKTLKKSNSWTVKWTNQLYYKGKKEYKYRIIENDVPANYEVSYEQFDIPTNPNSVDDGDKFTAKATNTLVPGHLKLHKDSELPDMTDDNKCYSLKDAQYEVYTDSACTTKATYIGGPLKTDAKGDTDVIKLLPGTYWVKEKGTGEKVGGKEKSYAKGFFVDTTAHKVTVKKEHTEDKPLVKKVEEPAMNDPLGIQITKESLSPTTSTMPSLAGAEFTIRYYDTLEDLSTLKPEINRGKVTPKRVWVIKTRKVGNRYIAGLSDSYKVSGDDFYLNEAGNPILPFGTITVQETKPAPGYALNGKGHLECKDGTKIKDNEVYFSQIKESHDKISLSGGNEYTMKNSPAPMSCKIIKYDADGNVLPGVTYKITDEAGNAVKDTDGNTIGEKTTGSDGIVKFEKLHPNVYLVTETSTVDGTQLLAEPIRVEVPMRMTKEEARKQNLDTSDEKKVVWSEEENVYLILECTFEVTNHPTFAMPMSGGTVNGWTFIPLVLGMGVFAGVAIVLFRKKKRTVKA